MTAGPKAPFEIVEREIPEPGLGSVRIKVQACGVCHSDIHQVRDEWGDSIYPMVPGHEIVGKVKAIGKKVKKFKVGDLAAVGVMIDSCRKCANCKNLMEQYCAEDMTGTYNTGRKGRRR